MTYRPDEAVRLMDAMLALHTPEEFRCFFEDLCTIQELKSMEQRFHVARLLRQGMTYAAVSETTGASTATISRVNRSLLYGAEGYTTVLNRMDEMKEEEK